MDRDRRADLPFLSTDRMHSPDVVSPGLTRGDLLRVLTTEPQHLRGNAKFIVYGAGGFGRKIGRLIEEAGFDILFFLDRERKAEFPWEVQSIEDVNAGGMPCGVVVVMAIFNGYFDLRDVCARLKERGFESIVSAVELVHSLEATLNRAPGDVGDSTSAFPHYWLDTRRHYLERQGEILTALDLFGDEVSKVVYLSTWCYRISGDLNYLMDPRPAYEHYFDQSLPRWGRDGVDPLRLIDCGAFTGDTHRSARRHGYAIAAYAGFEPDLGNYQKLCAEVKSAPPHDAVLFPCAAYSKAATLEFLAGQGSGSSVVAAGNQSIQGIAIDDCLNNFRPNLIKMDVEGAEAEAIAGALGTIRETRPGLAIAAYHKPHDIWELAKLLCGLDTGYRLFLRSYFHQGMDTVMYSVPVGAQTGR